MRVRSLGREDPPEEGVATHSTLLAWRIPWTEELGGLQSMGSQRVRHDSATWHPPPFHRPSMALHGRLPSHWSTLTSARVHLPQEHPQAMPLPLGLPEAAPWPKLARICLVTLVAPLMT